MTTAVAPTSGTSLLSSYITQSQQGTQAAEQAMANNVSNGVDAGASASSVAGNFNTFLQILTTQLQNQDPTDPMDSNTFTQELVEFSGVEQQLNTNSLLQQLVNLQGGQGGVKSLLNYVGSYVQVPSTNNDILVQGGTANFAYTLPSAAQSVVLTVKDASGNTVATMNGPTTSGVNNVSWNGSETDGSQAPDGVYTIAIAAADSGGNALTATNIQLTGQVTGVQTADSNGNDLLLGPYLTVDDANVDAVYAPGYLPQGTNTNNTNS
jgi:flagellar basal-body rod modification protein FlgD